MTNSRYLWLDMLRGVAAGAVVMAHVQLFYGPTRWVAHGYLTVDLFFMLSGVVLEAKYGQALRTRHLSLPAFLGLRAMRFYPLLTFALLLGSAAWVLGVPGFFQSIPQDWGDELKAALLVPTLRTTDDYVFPANSPLWSLLAELVTNLAWVVVIRLRRERWATVLACFGLVGVFVLCGDRGKLDIGNGGGIEFYAGLVRAFAEFCIGTWLFRAHQAPSLVGLFRSSNVRTGLLSVCLALILCAHAALPWYLADLVCILAFCAVLPVLLHARNPPGRVGEVMKWLGLLSFPVYVLHIPLMRWARWAHLTLQLHGRYPPWPAALAYAAGLLALSFFAHRAFEVPIQRQVRRYLAGRFGAQ